MKQALKLAIRTLHETNDWFKIGKGVQQSWILSACLFNLFAECCCSVAQLCPIFVTPWTTPHQASLSFPISWSLLKLMSIELVMPSSHLTLCHPLLLLPSIFPNIRSFPVSQLFASGGQSIGASASASVLPINIQGWFTWLTGLISLLSKGLSRVFSGTAAGKHLFFSAQPSLWSNSHICMWLLEKT